MSNRLDKGREEALQPKRVQYADEKITELGYDIIYKDKTRIDFIFKDHKVSLFPYSGWHSGKSIKDGRGIDKLLKQIKL
jgi:hypothetical protein